MLSELYQTIDSPEELGKNIVLPEHSTEAVYLSQHGELFCYSGIYSREESKFSFEDGHIICGASTQPIIVNI